MTSVVEANRTNILTVEYNVTGAEPVFLYAERNRFSPNKLTVRVIDGKLSSVKVSGIRILKSGSLGTAHHHVYLWKGEEVWPQWVRTTVDGLLAEIGSPA